ncbi:MAG TPA: hypothetical protein VNH13_06315 [Candidatus Acidoferrales bacterium]|nr:hypothetical protein [Candidatus Acidoferrales bacterium]
MSRREAWLSAGLVFGVALVVRAWAATLLPFPRPEDTAYYVSVAGNLLSGHGLTIDAIWSYGTPPLTFPRPAFEVWLPLPTFLMAIPMALFGQAFAAAQVASVLEGALLAPLAWRLAADVAAERELPTLRARWLALGTGLGVAVYLPLVLASVQPDSTMPFAVLVLGVVLLANRLLARMEVRGPQPAERPRLRFSRKPPRVRPMAGAGAGAGARAEAPGALAIDAGLGRGLVAMGALIGLAALTRNEAIWLALTWAVLAWRATRPAGGLGARARAALPLVGIPAVVSIAIFAPWAIRDWLTFGSLLPGQTLSNAVWLHETDVFAWASPPTLARYLGAGVGTLIGLRVTAFLHDLGSVLLALGIPISALGIVALPWTGRGVTLRPLVVFSIVTFAIATLVFPVATTRGTFLHASGAIHVLVILSAVLALDALVEWIKVARAWTGRVAWVGPLLTVFASASLTAVLLPLDGAAATAVGARYAALPAAMEAAGAPLPDDGSPVMSDFPIWLATGTGHRAIALPRESAASVIELARTFKASLLIVQADTGGTWFDGLDANDPATACFQPVALPDSGPGEPLEDVQVFRIACPDGS